MALNRPTSLSKRALTRRLAKFTVCAKLEPNSRNMPLRIIALVVAILSGLGALYFSHFKVKPKIDNLIVERDTAQNERDTSRDNERKAKADATKARADLDTTRSDLEKKTAEFDQAQASLKTQLARANQLSVELTRVTGERNEAQQELSSWRATGLKFEDIVKLKSEFARVTEERNVIADENKLLDRKNKELQVNLDKYEGGMDKDPEMPAGLRGRIVAIDPKFDFVILDIGGNHGVVERGKLLVRRDDKWVGAVRISRVEPNQSVANLIPEMTQTEIQEGDAVLY